MLIEIHLLKNYVSSNLNRDENGSPKSCYFGGETRGRISSQCIKRAIRNSEIFRGALGQNQFGYRTRKLAELVKNELIKHDLPEEFLASAMKKTTGFGNKDGKENNELKTPQLMFYSHADVKEVAEGLLAAYKANRNDINKFEKFSVKKLQLQMKDTCRPLTLDIAIFGRMATSVAFRNVESAIQVAHSISTNRLEPESDFFVTMDDLMTDREEAGAGMIGDTEFNSNCYYQYLSIDIDQLIYNLKDVENYKETAIVAILALLRTFIYVSPSGKQNSFAAHQLPSVIYIEVKNEKIPISYANGFVKPAFSGWKDDGITRRYFSVIEDSINKLVDEVNRTQRKFDIDVRNRLWFTSIDDITEPDNSLCFHSLSNMKYKLESLIREVI